MHVYNEDIADMSTLYHPWWKRICNEDVTYRFLRSIYCKQSDDCFRFIFVFFVRLQLLFSRLNTKTYNYVYSYKGSWGINFWTIFKLHSDDLTNWLSNDRLQGGWMRGTLIRTRGHTDGRAMIYLIQTDRLIN